MFLTTICLFASYFSFFLSSFVIYFFLGSLLYFQKWISSLALFTTGYGSAPLFIQELRPELYSYHILSFDKYISWNSLPYIELVSRECSVPLRSFYGVRFHFMNWSISYGERGIHFFGNIHEWNSNSLGNLYPARIVLKWATISATYLFIISCSSYWYPSLCIIVIRMYHVIPFFIDSTSVLSQGHSFGSYRQLDWVGLSIFNRTLL
jgi:hypothetical protein